MSDIVYTETKERRDHLDATLGSEESLLRTTADHKITIFQSKTKVAFVESALVVGVPNHGHRDKRWYKWRSTASSGLRRNSNGTVIPYNCFRRYDAKVGVQWTHRHPNVAFERLEEMSDAAAAYRHAVWETFGIKDFSEVFPIAEKYGIVDYRYMPRELRGGMRQNTFKGFVGATFGTKRMTPRFIAAVENTDPWLVDYAYQFRGYVHDSMMTDFLEANHFDDEMMGVTPFNPSFRKAVKFMSQKTRNHLMCGRLDYNDMNSVSRFIQTNLPFAAHLAHVRHQDAKTWQELASL